MDVIKNSNESVLIGVLSIYSGSRGKADRLLLDVVRAIDETRALNATSSPEIWNAFKNSWSRFEVEAVGSDLDTPFAIIDPAITVRNMVNFDISLDAERSNDVGAYQRYDPRFWLPVIAYCLEKVAHQSELGLLIDSSAISYALVCLSSKDEAIRKMGGSILLQWERLCQVCLEEENC